MSIESVCIYKYTHMHGLIEVWNSSQRGSLKIKKKKKKEERSEER